MTISSTTKRVLFGGIGILMAAAPLAATAAAALPAGATGIVYHPAPHWTPAPTITLTAGNGFGYINGSGFTPNQLVDIGVGWEAVSGPPWVSRGVITVRASAGHLDCVNYVGCERIDGTIATTEGADNGYVSVVAFDRTSGARSNEPITFIPGPAD